MNNKQTKQVVILSALMLTLVIAVVMQFTGAKKDKKTATPPTASATETSAPATDAAPADQSGVKQGLEWVDSQRIPGMVAEVTNSRNPFASWLDSVLEVAISNPNPSPTPPTGSLIPTGGEGTGVLPGGGTGTNGGVGPLPPPPPEFRLSGIISSPTERYAAMTVNGHYYRLMEGDLIPGLGWKAKKITDESVLMVKGDRSVPVRLSSGGSTK